MIFKTLPELIDQKNRIDNEIKNYDSVKMWKEVFRKMSIPENSISYEDDSHELQIRINNNWNLYSWYMPKGVYYIRQTSNNLIITMPHDMGTVRDNQ